MTTATRPVEKGLELFTGFEMVVDRRAFWALYAVASSPKAHVITFIRRSQPSQPATAIKFYLILFVTFLSGLCENNRQQSLQAFH